MRYRLDPAQSRLVITGRSTLHAITARGDQLTGEIVVDWESPEPTATVMAPLERVRFGDFVRDAFLRRHLDVKQWPLAIFTLDTATITGTGGERRAALTGTLCYRAQSAQLSTVTTVVQDRDRIDATARFPLDLRDFGLTPPKLLMLEVNPVVQIDVTLVGKAS